MNLDIQDIINNCASKTAKKTVMELKAAGLLKDARSIVYRDISKRLRSFYHGDPDEALKCALDQIKDDVYFDILPLYYFSGNTIEHIASGYDVDISTITRNKKRLCYEIYELMEGTSDDNT